MLKKVFIQCLFGKPFDWTEQYLSNIKMLAPYGWSLKIFTPNVFPVPSNVELIPMTLQEYDVLVEKHCGVKVGNFINAKGVPNKLTSDHYPAQGLIFQYYLKDEDYWGITNWDCVYGRLDRMIPDSELEKWEVWSDDPCGFNGIFTLMKNTEKVNNLFRDVRNWEHFFTVHEPCAFDEIRFSETLRLANENFVVRWGHPIHFPMHSYDRLPAHNPTPHLYFEKDGSLIEWYEDMPSMPATKLHYGREIFLFHFSQTKRWPVGRKPA